MVEEKAELRSGITAPFNKRLNEALQFNPQMPFNIGNTVTPSQLIGVLKGEQGTPGLPAAISVIKDETNLIMLPVTSLERGILTISNESVVFGGIGTKSITFTVPLNKKYDLKGYTSDVSGTATVSFNEVSIFKGGKQIKLYSASTFPSSIQYFTSKIVLDYGSTLVFTYNVTANTDGTGRARIIYNEIDI